jgi:glycerophosphoryl diester phosphodiesterase
LSAALAVSAVYVFNASWRVSAPDEPELRLIAHRGVHQTFSREALKNDTCTAEHIHPPTHGYIENTVNSMRAAFNAGADIVELDVHPTTDGYFAIIHDWTLDCRTDGSGVTRSHDLAYLKSLDVGYGYTADGGRSLPLRGHGVGLMPELGEVFSAFPNGRFLINFKSRETREGDMLASFIAEHPEWRSAVWGVYGGDEPTHRAAELLGDDLKFWSRRGLVGCLGRYIALGWMGVMPVACRNTTLMLPANVAPWLWGWPNLFLQRFHAVGSEVILLGSFSMNDLGTSGIDTVEDLTRVPAGFSGYLWTNRIEIIGPAVRGKPLG